MQLDLVIDLVNFATGGYTTIWSDNTRTCLVGDFQVLLNDSRRRGILFVKDKKKTPEPHCDSNQIHVSIEFYNESLAFYNIFLF